ncbi:MAG: hypothetical protein K0R08_1247 [Solimicrobium sp.]|nr:hypothetical protein [Solimicrobium sp.]
MDCINYKSATYSLQSQFRNEAPVPDLLRKQIEMDKALQLYQELSAVFLMNSCQFEYLVLTIQRNVNEGQRDEETVRCATEQFNELFPDINNALQSEELVRILCNLAKSSSLLTIGPDDLPMTVEVKKLLEKVERLQRGSQSIFDLLPKDIKSRLLSYLDIQSLRAIRLVSQSTCDMASEKLTLRIPIDFQDIKRRGILEDVCEFYENLTLPFVSIGIEPAEGHLKSFSQLMRSLSKNTKIKEIELCVAESNLGDSAALAVSEVPTITTLDISGNDLTAAGALYISKMPKLTTLNINYNNLMAIGAQYISRMQNLTRLEISSNDLRGHGAKHVARMTNLTYLDISNNRIGSVGARLIEGVSNLDYLNISGNDMTETELALELFQEVSKGWDCSLLEHFMGLILDIENKVEKGQWGEETAKRFNNMLATLLSPKEDKKGGADALIIAIGKLANCVASQSGKTIIGEFARAVDEQIQEIIFRPLPKEMESYIFDYLDGESICTTRLVSKAARNLAEEKLTHRLINFENINRGKTSISDLCTYFGNLNLSFLNITITAQKRHLTLFTHFMKSLSANTAIKEIELCIAGSKLGDSAALAVSKVNNIITLDISENNLTATGAQYISTMPNLTTLNIGNNKLEAAGAQYLSTVPNLTSLIIFNNYLTDSGAQHIAEMTKLTRLDIYDNQLSTIGVEHISRMSNLTTLDIGYNKCTDMGQHISTMSGLTALSISGNNFTDTDIQHISGMTNLTMLDIADTDLGELGAQHIAKMSNLTHLIIYANELGDAGAQHIAGMPNLTDLDIFGNYLTKEGAKYIAEMTNLTTLNIGDNSLGYEGASYIASLKNLATLDISSNELYDDGAYYISTMRNLTHLNVSSNGIWNIGAAHLQGMDLRKFDISDNDMDDVYT